MLGSLNKRHQAGVPPPRAGSGRLPGGACIPPLLESWKHKVLLAGKYLNVIRECGIEVQKVTNLRDDDLGMDDERSAFRIHTWALHTLTPSLKLLQIH